MNSIVGTTDLRTVGHVALKMRFWTTVEEDHTLGTRSCVWSAASRVVIGQARTCGEGVMCLRDVG